MDKREVLDWMAIVLVRGGIGAATGAAVWLALLDLEVPHAWAAIPAGALVGVVLGEYCKKAARLAWELVSAWFNVP